LSKSSMADCEGSAIYLHQQAIRRERKEKHLPR
jgi:hypothetical protein